MSEPVLIATAGHVDHGKSTLVHQLTGTDPDRWEIEKARGITIDLGYAHVTIDGVTFSFVDVPGHEKFIHNMLAGIGSIDAVLFVIAADESIMPQTREHALALRYLGIEQVHVVITKVDLVNEDLMELLHLEIEEFLEENGWQNAACVPFSSKMPETRQPVIDLLCRLGKKVPSTGLGFRLSIDRVFTSPGSGTVLTGTVDRGRLSLQDRVFLEPGGGESRIRQLQQHGEKISEVGPHSRVAINLGDVHYRQASRGQCLFSRIRPPSASRVLLRLNDFEEDWAPGPKHFFHLYHLASRQRARMMWREGQIAAVELQQPHCFWALDRGLIRDGSPLRICAGFEVLDPSLYRSKKRQVHPRLANIPPAGDLTAWQKWYLAGQEGVIDLDSLAAKCGEDLQSEAAADLVMLTPRAAVSEPKWQHYRQEFLAVLASCHLQLPLFSWLPRSMVRSLLQQRRWSAILIESLHSWAGESGEIEIAEDRMRRAGYKVKWTPQHKALLGEFLALAKENQGIVDLKTVADRPRFSAVEEMLIWEKFFVNLTPELLIQFEALNHLMATLAAKFRDEVFSIQELKSEFNFSRKYAIPLLEYLDKNGWTRREETGRRWIAGPPPLLRSDFQQPV